MEKGERGMMRILAVLLSCMLLLFGVVVVLALVLWWLISRSSKPREAPVIEIEIPAGELKAVPPAAVVESPDVAAETPAMVKVEPRAPEKPAAPDDLAGPDNLERIEGIGPKIASVLRAAGIVTFAQLAATDVSRIEQILEEKSPRLRRLVHPATWPEQASLAASGDWEALEALQHELKGGRRAGVA
jgi:predicted flap endonuclease-1-like 5' DNA nuclease